MWTLHRKIIGTTRSWFHAHCDVVIHAGHVQYGSAAVPCGTLWETLVRTMGRHLPYGITVLPATRHRWTTERAPPCSLPVSWYSIYLPWRDGRLSWPRLTGNAPTDIFTKLTLWVWRPNHYTTEPALHSASTSHLLVPPVRLSTVSNWVFTLAGSRIWNTLLEEMSPQSMMIFCWHLKTPLLRKSYYHLNCHLFICSTVNCSVI